MRLAHQGMMAAAGVIGAHLTTVGHHRYTLRWEQGRDGARVPMGASADRTVNLSIGW